MGCAASHNKTQYDPEKRICELDECCSVSCEVRWVWLQGKTLFTFAELRMLLKLYQTATAGVDDNMVVGTNERHSDPEVVGPYTAAPSFTTTEAGDSLPGKESAVGTMNKQQFLAACKTDGAFRLPEVVGHFGSRLFDVLDRDGDGALDFEDFAIGMSKLLKGPESEKLNLMYCAYDLSGVAPSGQRRRKGRGHPGKPLRRNKFLTLDDMVAVLTSASKEVYSTLLKFTARSPKGASASGRLCATGRARNRSACSADELKVGTISVKREASVSSDGCGGQAADGCGPEVVGNGDGPSALEVALEELARRNAASFVERAISEFGRAQNGALTPKEFEKWASTGPVMRCQLLEFSLDVNVVPFQGIRFM